MSFAEGRVGFIAKLAEGISRELRLGLQGELIVGNAGLGKYFEQNRAGNLFIATNQAGVALTAGLNAVCTGLILNNPRGSGKKLVLLEYLAALTSAPAGAATLGLAMDFGLPSSTGVTHTAALSPGPINLKTGKSNSVALADSSATLPNTPVFVRPVGGGPVATGSIESAFIRDEIDGAIVIPEGASIATFSLTTAISVMSALLFAEIET